MYKLDLIKEPCLVGKELNIEACTELAHAVVKHALFPPEPRHVSIHVKPKNLEHAKREVKNLNKHAYSRCKKAIKFGEKSELLTHFCDIFNINEKATRDAIIQRNTLASNKLYKYL